MKKLIKVVKSLGWIDAILWATPVLILLASCSKVEEYPSYKVTINSGTLEPEVVVSDQPLKLGELVEYEGHYYLVVEN
jgi:hypothetical protein